MSSDSPLLAAMRQVDEDIQKMVPARHPPAPKPVDALLDERGKTHGEYSEHARITQNLKNVMRTEENWNGLNLAQRESLEMIAHKIGRILAGNPNHADHWDDIAGYARLVSQRL